MATALYNGVKIRSAGDNGGKTFKFHDTWKVLREHQNFMGGEDIKSSSRSVENHTTTTTTEATFIQDHTGSSGEGQSDTNREARPIPRRKTKSLLGKDKMSRKK